MFWVFRRAVTSAVRRAMRPLAHSWCAMDMIVQSRSMSAKVQVLWDAVDRIVRNRDAELLVEGRMIGSQPRPAHDAIHRLDRPFLRAMHNKRGHSAKACRARSTPCRSLVRRSMTTESWIRTPAHYRCTETSGRRVAMHIGFLAKSITFSDQIVVSDQLLPNSSRATRSRGVDRGWW